MPICTEARDHWRYKARLGVGPCWGYGGQLLLGRRVSHEGGCCLQVILRDIDDDARTAVHPLLLDCRERNGYLLVANAEITPDIDDGRRHLAIRSDEDVLDGPELIACAVVDVLVD